MGKIQGALERKKSGVRVADWTVYWGFKRVGKEKEGPREKVGWEEMRVLEGDVRTKRRRKKKASSTFPLWLGIPMCTESLE